MSECFRELFLLDGKSYKCADFPLTMVYSGESVYEVIRIVKGKSLFLPDHLQRLRETARIRSRKLDLTDKGIKQQICDLLELNKIDAGNVKLVFNFESMEENKPHFLAYFIEHHYPTAFQFREGVRTILFHAERTMPNAKTINPHLRSAIFKKLLDAGAYEALLVNKQGLITEGSRSNVFFIKDDEFYTAPEKDVLAGIARKYVLEIANKNRIKVNFTKISVSEISGFSAVFITGTSPGVLPVSKIEEFRFDPKNSLLMEIRDQYQQMTNTE
jgi:branched-chain amino acid aminotransferase